MKKQHKLFSKLFLVLSIAAFTATAQDKVKEKKRYEFWKERNVSQSYNVSSGDKLDISNQFGKVDIKTWNKNEVKVDIHIETSSTVKEANDRMFDRIEIKHGKSGNTVSFKTDMESNNKDEHREYKGSQSNNIQIDYDVYMPANMALDLKHRFGKATVPDLTGKVNIDQQFGELVAGKLSNPGKIDVRFSKASFEGLRDAKLELQFASLPVVIKNVTGDFDLKVQHSKSVTIYADDLTSLDVDAQFSDIGVVVAKNASANFDVKTHFGSFVNNTNFNLKNDDEQKDDRRRYGPTFDSRFKGAAGAGKVKVNLNGNFSDFILGHEAPTFKDKSSKERTRGQRSGTI
jgi:hypothetical protein